MNITLIIGWVIAFGLILYGIFNGGQLAWFIDIPSLAITVGGTFGVLIAVSPLSLLKSLPKLFKIAILPPKFKAEDYITQIVEFANTARSKGWTVMSIMPLVMCRIACAPTASLTITTL